MTWALLGIVATLIGWSITLTLWWRKADSERDAALMLLDGEHKAHDETKHILEVEQHNVSLLKDDLTAHKALLSTVQRQRNEAMEQARDYFVQRLQNAGTAEAAKAVADLLAAPVHDLMLPKAKRSDDPKDGLIDPFAEARVQSAAGTVADPNQPAR